MRFRDDGATPTSQRMHWRRSDEVRELRPDRPRRRLCRARRGGESLPRVRRERRAGRADALGRVVPERGLPADEGIPRRRRADARRPSPCGRARDRPAGADHRSRSHRRLEELAAPGSGQLGRGPDRSRLRGPSGRGDVRRPEHRRGRRQATDGGEDPDRDRRADRRPADSGDRERRLDRPRQRARAPRGSRVAAHRRRRPGRARVRPDLRALQLAARADTEAANELQAALEDEGIEVVLNGGVDSFSRNGKGVDALLGGRRITVSHVLLASGRTANVEELALDRIGVEVTRGGIAVDDRQRTNVEGIWAAGDVAAGPMFTPTAQYQARVAVEDMFGDGSRRADYSVLPTAIFTDPELAGVGLTESEASERGLEFDVVKHPLPAVTRAQYTGTRHGLYKIVFDQASRRVLGIHVVSRGASDIVGGLAVALKLGVTVDDLAGIHHVYPSYSEGIKAAAEKANVKVATAR